MDGTPDILGVLGAVPAFRLMGLSGKLGCPAVGGKEKFGVGWVDERWDIGAMSS